MYYGEFVYYYTWLSLMIKMIYIYMKICADIIYQLNEFIIRDDHNGYYDRYCWSYRQGFPTSRKTITNT